MEPFAGRCLDAHIHQGKTSALTIEKNAAAALIFLRTMRAPAPARIKGRPAVRVRIAAAASVEARSTFGQVARSHRFIRSITISAAVRKNANIVSDINATLLKSTHGEATEKESI